MRRLLVSFACWCALLSPLSASGIDGRAYMACDGKTDDTAGFQAAISAAAKSTLSLPNGVCIISNSVAVTNTIHIVGDGGGSSSLTAGTTLEWRGPASLPMLDLQGITDSVFEDFLIESNATYPLAIGVRSITIAGKYANASKFHHLQINGTSAGGLGKGFAFVAGSGGDNNNDENTFEDVTVRNFAIAGWSFEHSQSKAHRLLNCRFYGTKAANSYGVTTALTTSWSGGSFFWYGGFGYGSGEADFYLGGPDDAILISGGNFEGSARLLETVGASSNSFPITIEGVRWAGDGLAGDGKAIIYTQRGPLNLHGNIIGQYPNKPLQVYINDWSTPIVATAIGNTFMTSLGSPFQGNGTWVVLANILNGGPATVIPNRVPQ